MVVTADAPQPELAAKFQQLVTGELGQKTLATAGFAAP
jgi:ABC-type molybdate transport system substrate-binding protein